MPGCTVGIGLGQYHFVDAREFAYFIRPARARAQLATTPAVLAPNVPAELTFTLRDYQGDPGRGSGSRSQSNNSCDDREQGLSRSSRTSTWKTGAGHAGNAQERCVSGALHVSESGPVSGFRGFHGARYAFFGPVLRERGSGRHDECPAERRLFVARKCGRLRRHAQNIAGHAQSWRPCDTRYHIERDGRP